MAKKGGPPAQGGENNELMIFVSVVLVGIIAWWALSPKVAAVVLGIRLAETWLFSLFTGHFDELRAWMKVIDRRVVTFSDLYQVSDRVGSWTRWLTTPVLIYLGYKLMRSSPTDRFKRRFTETTLPIEEADLYPWIKISTKIDFSSLDTDKGPWAMAQTERQFARIHRLKNERGEYDRERAEMVFVKQIGPPWLGYKRLKPHARALFAMFLARMERDYKSSDKLLLQLAHSAATGKLDYSGVDELVAKHEKSRRLKKLLKQHAYERTLLMSMLEMARGGEAGKDYLPPNWFLWCKGVERELWYPLHDVGRRAPHVESAGAFAHWLTEKAIGKRQDVPFVRTAVDGLQSELAKYTDEEDEDGIDLDEEARDIPPPPPPEKIPTPQEADEMFRRSQMNKARQLKNSAADDED
jgi:intracellular multiplication protein IcmP